MTKQTILVADDDPMIRQVYEIALGEVFTVISARDGLEAWKLLQQHHPALVVTDLNMPGMNGLEFTTKIREDERFAKIPVIILTGTTKDSDLPPGFWNLGTGADAFLEKPITPDDLINEIRCQLMKLREVKPLPPGKGHYDVS